MNYVVWNFNWTVPFETVDYLKITHRKPRKNNCINMHCVLNPLRLIILGCILNIKPWFKNQITFAHQKLSYLFSRVVDWSHLNYLQNILSKKEGCVDPIFLVVVYYCTLFEYNNLIIVLVLSGGRGSKISKNSVSSYFKDPLYCNPISISILSGLYWSGCYMYQIR